MTAYDILLGVAAWYAAKALWHASRDLCKGNPYARPKPLNKEGDQ